MRKEEYPASGKCRSLSKCVDENNSKLPRFTIIFLKLATRLNTNLTIMFARLQIQYGAGNCKKGYYYTIRELLALKMKNYLCNRPYFGFVFSFQFI